MKAAVVHDFTSPLSIEDVPTPEPGEGQVRVRIEASGLCHTDIHAAHGDWPVKPTLPLIPGHEGVGIVEALGPGANGDVKEGDRVAIPWPRPARRGLRHRRPRPHGAPVREDPGRGRGGRRPARGQARDGHHDKGSIVGTHHDLEDVFKLHALGRTRVLYETRPLEQVNEAFEEVEQARTKAPRVVLRP